MAVHETVSRCTASATPRSCRTARRRGCASHTTTRTLIFFFLFSTTNLADQDHMRSRHRSLARRRRCDILLYGCYWATETTALAIQSSLKDLTPDVFYKGRPNSMSCARLVDSPGRHHADGRTSTGTMTCRPGRSKRAFLPRRGSFRPSGGKMPVTGTGRRSSESIRARQSDRTHFCGDGSEYRHVIPGPSIHNVRAEPFMRRSGGRTSSSPPGRAVAREPLSYDSVIVPGHHGARY